MGTWQHGHVDSRMHMFPPKYQVVLWMSCHWGKPRCPSQASGLTPIRDHGCKGTGSDSPSRLVCVLRRQWKRIGKKKKKKSSRLDSPLWWDPAPPQLCGSQSRASDHVPDSMDALRAVTGTPQTLALPLAKEFRTDLTAHVTGSLLLSSGQNGKGQHSPSTKTASPTNQALVHPSLHTSSASKTRGRVCQKPCLQPPRERARGAVLTLWNSRRKERSYSPRHRSSILSLVTWCRVLVTASALTRSNRLSLCLEESPACGARRPHSFPPWCPQ